MTPRRSLLLWTGVVFCAFLQLVVGQMEAMDARDHLRIVHDKPDRTDVPSSSKSSHPGLTAATLVTTPLSTTNVSNGTPGTALPLGFGSDCSHERQCNALLGLACISNENGPPMCACASSAPVYINEGGVQKCVRAKNLNEACVSNQECSFDNPNVQCINSFCNCSHPFQLTAARHCLLPSNQGGDIFTIALSVMLALALLLLVAGYAYQKMVRERAGSSSSTSTSSGSRRSKRKRKRDADVSTTSSTACILTKDRPLPDVDSEGEYSAGDEEGSEEHGESRRQARVVQHGSYLREHSLVPPRHPPLYISQQAAKGRKVAGLPTVQETESSSSEGDEQLHSSSSSVADKPERDSRATPLYRTCKGRHLPILAERKTGLELRYDEPDCSSSSPMHMLRPKDEQMQRILGKQQVVVTIETHERRSLGTAPSPPPIVSLRRRELPLSESTDDSFMKDLKRRLSLKARFSDDLCGLTPVMRSASAEPIRVAAGAVQCDAAQGTPAEAGPQKAETVAKAQRDAEPPTAGVTFGTSVPVHGFTVSTKPAKKQIADIEHRDKGPEKAIEKAAATDNTSKLGQEHRTENSQPPLQLADKRDHFSTMPDRSSLNAGAHNAKRRRASSPPVLKSSGIEGRTEPNKTKTVLLPPAARADKVEGNVTRQSRVPVTVAAAGTNFEKKGNEVKMQCPEPNTASVLTELDAAKQLSENSNVNKRPAQPVPKGTNACMSSPEIADCKTPSQKERLKDELVDAGAGKLQQKQSDHLNIEEVGELARLLSRLIRKHEYFEHTSSAEDSANSAPQRPLKSKRDRAKHSRSTYGGMKKGCRATEPTEGSSVGTSLQHFAEVIIGKVNQQSVTQKSGLPVQPDVSMAKLSLEPTTQHKLLSMEAFVRKTAQPEAPELIEAVSGKNLANMKQNTPLQADRPSLNQSTESTISEMKSQEEITPAEQSSLQTTVTESSADDAKYGSDRIGGRTPKPIPVSVPQDYRGWVPIGAAYAAQRPPKSGASGGLTELVGNTSGVRDISMTFSDGGGIQSVLRKKPSVSSTLSETTPSLSAQNPYQEYMAKQLQPVVHFAERPFAEVLASMESEITSMFKDDATTGVQGPEKGRDKSSPSSAPQCSTQSTMNDEKLDETAIESSSKGASETDSSKAVASGDLAETSGRVASTAAPPVGKIPVSSKAVTTSTSNESDEASKEAPRALPTFCDSDEGAVPPSESMSLSFVSSNSSCNAVHRLTDLVDLQRLQHSATAATHETGDGGVVLGMPLPRLTSSSAAQMESSRQPASSLTECGAQALLLTEPAGRSGWPQLRKTRRRDVGHRVSTDRPWTEDVKKVVMLGNKHYLQQHAGRRPIAKSATTFDETQCVLFKIEDHVLPDTTASPVAHDAPHSMSMSGELNRESCESTLELLFRRCTFSSAREVDTLASEDNNFEQPLSLSDLILLQHPEVGLRNFIVVDVSKTADAPSLTALSSAAATPAEGGAERQGVVLEAQPEDKQAPDLITNHKSRANEPMSEETRLTAAAVGIWREPFLAATVAGSKDSDALRKPQRPSLTKSAAEATDHERRLEQESAGAAAEAAAARATEPKVRFAPPLASRHVVFLPDCAAAIRLPGGVIRSVRPGQQAFSTASPQGRGAIRADHRSRQLLLATALDEPCFESIYNAILQQPPQVTAALEPIVPGEVPSPARATRAVSFDDSLTTVVHLEPPPESLTYDVADATAGSEPEAPSQWRKARRQSSLCRFLSGSRLQAPPGSPGIEGAKVACGTARKTIRFGGPGQLAPALARPGAAKDAGAEGTFPAGGGSGRRDTPTPLMSTFYSFEDTGSELSFLPESSNFDKSGSAAASQRRDDHKHCDEAYAPRPA
ncbi:platelet binding protein GspB-like isoform X1 [Dermacentor albipictus]|uniref:platelet binding protein GspB-like isoform X1 n=2 Tax=Dermacentor albipictus TaxID=60249 RepID=UPI0031FCFB63